MKPEAFLREIWARERERLAALSPLFGLPVEDSIRISDHLERLGFRRSAIGNKSQSGFVRGPCPRCKIVRIRGQIVESRGWLCKKCVRLEDAPPLPLDLAQERRAYAERIERDPSRLIGLRGRAPRSVFQPKPGARAGRA